MILGIWASILSNFIDNIKVCSDKLSTKLTNNKNIFYRWMVCKCLQKCSWMPNYIGVCAYWKHGALAYYRHYVRQWLVQFMGVLDCYCKFAIYFLLTFIWKSHQNIFGIHFLIYLLFFRICSTWVASRVGAIIWIGHYIS
jgi:hypothetical protein